MMIFECKKTDDDDKHFSYRSFLRLLLYIRQNEPIGISVPSLIIHELSESQPDSTTVVHNSSDETGIMHCWNYTDEQLESFNSQSHNVISENCPPGLSQTSVINNLVDGEESLPDIFEDIDGIPLSHENSELCHIRNPYGFLKPYFTQMIDCLEGNCTMQELINVKNSFMEITNSKRKTIRESQTSNEKDEQVSSKRTRYVSSNVISETKTKTHGTKHYS